MCSMEIQATVVCGVRASMISQRDKRMQNSRAEKEKQKTLTTTKETLTFHVEAIIIIFIIDKIDESAKRKTNARCIRYS